MGLGLGARLQLWPFGGVVTIFVLWAFLLLELYPERGRKFALWTSEPTATSETQVSSTGQIVRREMLRCAEGRRTDDDRREARPRRFTRHSSNILIQGTRRSRKCSGKRGFDRSENAN